MNANKCASCKKNERPEGTPERATYRGICKDGYCQSSVADGGYPSWEPMEEKK